MANYKSKILFTLIFTFIFLAGQISAQDLGTYELVEIAFEGNEAIEDDLLANVVTSSESPGWFSKFLNGISENWGNETVYFDTLLIEFDLKALQDYYFDNGFFKAKFTYRYEVDPEDEEAVLIFVINENDPCYFSGFEISNLEIIDLTFSTKITQDIIDVDSTERYSRLLVEEKIKEKRELVILLTPKII